MQSFNIGDRVMYVGGGRFAGNLMFERVSELRMGDHGIIHAIPGAHGELGCTFGRLKVSLEAADVRAVSLKTTSASPMVKSTSAPKLAPLASPALATSKTAKGMPSGLAAKSPCSLPHLPPRCKSQASIAASGSSAHRRSSSTSLLAAKPVAVSSFVRPSIRCASPFGNNCAQAWQQQQQQDENKEGTTQVLLPQRTENEANDSRLAGAAIADAQEDSRSESSSEPERPHPPSFYCPISRQCMHDPVVVSDGHTYERRYIERWLESNDTSPVSGAKLPHSSLVPNHALRNAIEEYFEQVLLGHREAIRQATAGMMESQLKFGDNTQLLRTIDSLMQCSILVSSDLSVEFALKRIMDEAKTLVGAEAASVFLLDKQRQELYSTVNSTGQEIRVPIKAGVAGHVASTGLPLIIPDAYNDPRFNTAVDKVTGFRTKSILCVPIKAWKGGIIGVAQLINKEIGGVIPSNKSSEQCFTLDDQQFFEVLAAQAGSAIVSSGMFEKFPSVREKHISPPRRKTSPQRSKPSSSKDNQTLAVGDDSKSTVERTIGMSPALQTTLKPLLSAAFGAWEIDTLAMAQLTCNRPLSVLAMDLFKRHGLATHFTMDLAKLESFLVRIEDGYPDSNKYHNRAHAASVLHFAHCILHLGGLDKIASLAASGADEDQRQKIVLLATLFAAVIHDYEHEGLNNDFLVKTQSEKALQYNDRSPNEQHHVAAAFQVLLRPENNFLEGLKAQEFKEFRALVIELVLGTDMADSGNIVKAFKLATECSAQESNGEATPPQPIFQPHTSSEAVLSLKIALKCADLGHLALSWSSHMQWVQRLENEFFTQGDKERKLGMPNVSFLMDRNLPGVTQSQIGFFDFVVLPLFRTFAKAYPSCSPMLTAVETNYQRWQDVQTDLEAAL